MKTINKIIVVAIGAILALTGCKKDEIMSYSGETNVYFTLKKWPLRAASNEIEYDNKTYQFRIPDSDESIDNLSSSFAFVSAELNKQIAFIPLSIMGSVSESDRKVAYKVLPSSTATQGTDYNILDAYIAKGKTYGAIVVELIRDNLSKDGEYLEIHLGLEANENFKVDYNKIPFSGTRRDSIVSTITPFKLKFNDGLTEPEMWMYMEWYYGKYSQKKLVLLMTEFGAPLEHFYPSSGYPSGVVSAAYGTMLKKWLIQYEIDNKTPYLDEDGKPMTAGEGVY